MEGSLQVLLHPAGGTEALRDCYLATTLITNLPGWRESFNKAQMLALVTIVKGRISIRFDLAPHSNTLPKGAIEP